jgi:hypothetical protein
VNVRPGAQWRHPYRLLALVLVFWIIIGCGCYGAWRIFR